MVVRVAEEIILARNTLFEAKKKKKAVRTDTGRGGAVKLSV